MFTIGRSVRAFCFATVLAAALSGTALAAGFESVPNGKDRLPRPRRCEAAAWRRHPR